MPDALSLSRSELPEEIEKAIEALIDAEHDQVRKGGRDAETWCEATKACNQAREALTAAILSRLGEAEATEKELATLRRVHRWNVEHSDGGVLVCRNNHDKGDDCDWERFVPEERLTAALARVEHLEKALAEAKELASPIAADALCPFNDEDAPDLPDGFDAADPCPVCGDLGSHDNDGKPIRCIAKDRR